MTEYLIAFNGEWVPDLTNEDLREASERVSALRAEMKAAGVLIFMGGLDDAAPVLSIDASSGTPLITDGPFAETKEQLGGFAVIDVADEEAARLWAGRSRWPAVGRRSCDDSGRRPHPRTNR
ncbi:MAG TPA: YciI family protein [Actinomycetota bacterium]|nr:YciI family protein [Actinomycetota bacterium]